MKQWNATLAEKHLIYSCIKEKNGNTTEIITLPTWTKFRAPEMIYSLLTQQSFSLDKCRFWNDFTPWTLFFLQSSNPPLSPPPPLSLPLSWLIHGCCHLDEQQDPTTRGGETPASTQLPATHVEMLQSASNLLQLPQAPACLTGTLLLTVVHSVANLEPDPKPLKSTGVSPCQNLFWSLNAAYSFLSLRKLPGIYYFNFMHCKNELWILIHFGETLQNVWSHPQRYKSRVLCCCFQN